MVSDEDDLPGLGHGDDYVVEGNLARLIHDGNVVLQLFKVPVRFAGNTGGPDDLHLGKQGVLQFLAAVLQLPLPLAQQLETGSPGPLLGLEISQLPEDIGRQLAHIHIPAPHAVLHTVPGQQLSGKGQPLLGMLQFLLPLLRPFGAEQGQHLHPQALSHQPSALLQQLLIASGALGTVLEGGDLGGKLCQLLLQPGPLATAVSEHVSLHGQQLPVGPYLSDYGDLDFLLVSGQADTVYLLLHQLFQHIVHC